MQFCSNSLGLLFDGIRGVLSHFLIGLSDVCFGADDYKRSCPSYRSSISCPRVPGVSQISKLYIHLLMCKKAILNNSCWSFLLFVNPFFIIQLSYTVRIPIF